MVALVIGIGAIALMGNDDFRNTNDHVFLFMCDSIYAPYLSVEIIALAVIDM